MPSKPTAKNSKATKEEDELPQASSSRRRTGRTRISAACEACKRRKTKCTGEPLPCQSCQLLGTECVIDLALDMRRREAMQQTMHDLKSYQDLLAGFIECVRDGSSDVMQALQSVLRREDSAIEEISNVVQEWSQTIRDRTAGPDLDDRIFTASNTPSTPQSKPSASTQVETQSDEMVLDPLLRSEPSIEQDVRSPEFLSTVVQRIKESAETDAVNVLSSLLSTNSRGGGVSGLAHATRQRGSGRLDQETSSYRRRLVDEAHRDAGSSSTHSEVRSPETPATTGHLMNTAAGSIAEEYGDIYSPQAQGWLYPASSEVSNRVAPDLLVAKGSTGTYMRVPIHLVQPLLVPDESSMSRVYTDYLNGARQMLANNVPASDIIGSNNDVIVDLLFRDRRDGDKWDCSSWACDFCRGFQEFDIYVRLAGVYMLTRLMQWLLVPTAENFAKLPVVMRPSPLQCMVPHAGSSDLIIIPALRDAVVESPREWVTPLAVARLTVDWPHSEHDAAEVIPGSRSRRLTQRFIDHISEQNNWSVGAQILNYFPELAGRIRIHG